MNNFDDSIVKFVSDVKIGETILHVDRNRDFIVNSVEISDKLDMFGLPLVKINDKAFSSILTVHVRDDSKCKCLNVSEIGMVGHYENTKDCGYGCKILKCDGCGETFESHRCIYGCRIN